MAALDEDVAAICVGGCSYPYAEETVEPTKEFAQGLRRLADRSASPTLAFFEKSFPLPGGARCADRHGVHHGFAFAHAQE